ncbi:MAG: DUF6084 family protein [Gemmatimonadales bacterium]
MPDLTITVESAKVVSYAAAPTIAFQLRIINSSPDEVIDSVVLRAQLQLEVTRRQYSPEEEAELRDLFGAPDRWAQTLRAMLWTHASVIVPPFAGETLVDLTVPCTFDFNVAATKYFHGLKTGEIPVAFLFSGSVFFRDENGGMRVVPVSWEKEAKFKLPVSTWHGLMDSYYPNVAWLTLRRDVFDKLHRYKIDNGIPTWEQAIESMLAATKDEALA